MPEWFNKLKKNIGEDIDVIKATGFSNRSEASDIRTETIKKQGGDQLKEDMKLSPMERKMRVEKYFNKPE